MAVLCADQLDELEAKNLGLAAQVEMAERRAGELEAEKTKLAEELQTTKKKFEVEKTKLAEELQAREKKIEAERTKFEEEIRAREKDVREEEVRRSDLALNEYVALQSAEIRDLKEQSASALAETKEQGCPVAVFRSR